jgi:hypothetical protein
LALGAAWLALPQVPIGNAPFTEDTLQDARLLYEPTQGLALCAAAALAAMSARAGAAWVGGLAVGSLVLAAGNAVPWTEVLRASRALVRGVREWRGEAFTERWIVGVPRIHEGAHFFLEPEPVLVPPLFDSDLAARVHVATPERVALLVERLDAAGRRSETVTTWALERGPAGAFALLPVAPPALPAPLGPGVELRASVCSGFLARPGGDLEVALALAVGETAALPVVLAFELRSRVDGRALTYTRHGADAAGASVRSVALPLPPDAVPGAWEVAVGVAGTPPRGIGRVAVAPPHRWP